MSKEKLLYINNYNCTNIRTNDNPDNHLWGADYLSDYYDVVCAKIPESIIKKKFKGSETINNLYKSFILLLRYYKIPNVYAACGDLSTGFAFANRFHLGHRNLFQIQHHGTRKILCHTGYNRLIFISQCISDYYNSITNKITISWGGSLEFAKRYRENKEIDYDFISAGKTGRDHDLLITATSRNKGCKTVIVTGDNHAENIPENVTIYSSGDKKLNSLKAEDVFRLYSHTKFIVIPVISQSQNNFKILAGLTSFVDAVVMHKPILISDNTNMGIDFEKLGIGLVYKHEDADDMAKKMEIMLNMSDSEYTIMCENMAKYAEDHNYDTFCKKIYVTISTNLV